MIQKKLKVDLFISKYTAAEYIISYQCLGDVDNFDIQPL